MQNCRKDPSVQITGMLNSENIKLNKNYIWDTLEIDWKKVNVTFNNSKINLPRTVMIKLKDKIKIRLMMRASALSHYAKTRDYMVHIGI